MAKYKIYVNGNNQANNAQGQQQAQANQLIQQMAQNAANQQLQQQAQAQAEATDPMRQTVNDLLKNKLMNNIEVPQYTTIQDVLSAPKGGKLSAFANFLDNPETMRTIGDFLPYYGYDAKTGQGYNVMETPARRQEALMQQRQAQALQQLKEQNDIATALNHTYTQQDIANEQNKLRRDLAEQEMQFKREQMEEAKREKALDRAQQMQMLNMRLNSMGGSSGGGTATGGAANMGGVDLSNVKMTAADRKSLTENKTTLANIEAGLQSLEQNPNAYSWMKGVLGSDITNRIDPKGVATRTQIDNITAVYRKWLTGAQMSDKERKAYERFLPAPTDNYNIVKAKLEGMRGAIERSNDALLSNYGISSQGGMSMPKADMSAIEAEMKRRGLK